MTAALVFVSGAVLVAAEVLWARDWALVLGSTAEGAAIVLAATFAGLAAGSALGGRLQGRLRFARVEAGLAMTLLAYVVVRPAFGELAVALEGTAPTGARILVRGLLAGLAIGVPALLAGAALPAALEGRAANEVAGFYACSTLGGAAGALAVPAVLLGGLGLRASYVGLAAVSTALATIASVRPTPTTPMAPASSAVPPRRALVATAIAGAVGLGAEVLWARGLAGTLASSVYSVAIVLAVVLLGIVVGTVLGARVVRTRRPEPVAGMAFALAGVTIAVSSIVLGPLGAWAAPRFATASLAGALLLEGLVAAGVVFASAMALGAAFPAVVAWTRGDDAARTAGRLLAANTLGAVVGALATAFVLLPRLGLAASFLALAGIALLGSAVATAGRARAAAIVASVAAFALALPGGGLGLWRLPPSEHAIWAHDGPAATVIVTEDARGGRRLRVNGRYSLGGAEGLLLERRQGLIPMLLHPHPRRVLHVGVGTGDTMAAELVSPEAEVDGVELVPDILAASAWFGATNGALATNPRARLVADDVRSFLLRTGRPYDVVVADLFLPWTAGASALYSQELYEAVAAHLAPGGLLCHWLPLHQLAADDLASIVATFTGVFPYVEAWVAYHRARTPLLALIGRLDPSPLTAETVLARMADPAMAGALREVGLADVRDLGILYLTDGAHLRAATSGLAPITDDRPRLELGAPAAALRSPGVGAASLAWAAARLDPRPQPIADLAGVPAEVRALLLTAQLAMLAGHADEEAVAYVRASVVAPGIPTVEHALRAMASAHRAAGDAAGAAALERALGARD